MRHWTRNLTYGGHGLWNFFEPTPQFSSITEVSYPSVFERFLEIIGIFSFDPGWILSAACLAGVSFYDKLL